MLKKIKQNKILYIIYYLIVHYIPRNIHFFFLYLGRNYGRKYHFKEIRKYYRIHEGKRCFIVATAPSLCIDDLELIIDEYSFGVNSIVNVFDKVTWRPTYYGVQDSGVEKVKDKILKYRCEMQEFFVGISPIARMVPHFGCDAVNYLLDVLDHDKRGTKHILKATDRADHYLYDGFSITYSMIELAMYMGFKEIVLLGVDCDYSGNQLHFDNYTTEKVPNASINMYQAFCHMRVYAEKKGIRIMNASRGFKLKAFECRTLEDILGKEIL